MAKWEAKADVQRLDLVRLPSVCSSACPFKVISLKFSPLSWPVRQTARPQLPGRSQRSRWTGKPVSGEHPSTCQRLKGPPLPHAFSLSSTSQLEQSGYPGIWLADWLDSYGQSSQLAMPVRWVAKAADGTMKGMLGRRDQDKTTATTSIFSLTNKR